MRSVIHLPIAGFLSGGKWAFVSVLGAYFAEILKSTASCYFYDKNLGS